MCCPERQSAYLHIYTCRYLRAWGWLLTIYNLLYCQDEYDYWLYTTCFTVRMSMIIDYIQLALLSTWTRISDGDGILVVWSRKHGSSVGLEKRNVEVRYEEAQRGFLSQRKGKVIPCRGAEDGKGAGVQQSGSMFFPLSTALTCTDTQLNCIVCVGVCLAGSYPLCCGLPAHPGHWHGYHAGENHHHQEGVHHIRAGELMYFKGCGWCCFSSRVMPHVHLGKSIGTLWTLKNLCKKRHCSGRKS